MEGHSGRVYMLGMVKALDLRGWDSCAVNFRGCSGETNKKIFTYHAGRSDDLYTVIKHVLGKNKYKNIALIGFSLGGNIILKYLGERKAVSPLIKCAVCTSVPIDLTASAWKLAEKSNSFYMKRFLKKFYAKMLLKKKMFPEKIDLSGFDQLKTFKDYDERYTAPLNGFKSAEDYWEKSSSKQFLKNIKVPSLIISAGNDPFLTPECFPKKQAEENSELILEVPESGGHVGFITLKKEFWHETRAVEFIKAKIQ
jgi:predicted alpha/beta-fold hydrolase